MTFNAMTEHYEEITVCGKPALFTSIRIYKKSPMHERKISHVWRFLFYPKSTLALRCTSFSIIFKRFGGRL